MKAIVQDKYGSAEVLRFEDIDPPEVHLLTVVAETPVSVLVAMIVTPGINAPDASCTVPPTVELDD